MYLYIYNLSHNVYDLIVVKLELKNKLAHMQYVSYNTWKAEKQYSGVNFLQALKSELHPQGFRALVLAAWKMNVLVESEASVKERS